jgi:hypothetical protein
MFIGKPHLALHRTVEPSSDSADDDGSDPADLVIFHCKVPP